MEDNVRKVWYATYLTVLCGVNAAEASGYATLERAKVLGVQVIPQDDALAFGAAAALGAHDSRAGNPPRTLAEMTREVDRMLAPEAHSITGRLIAAWYKAEINSDVGRAVTDLLRSEGYVRDDNTLTHEARALAGLS